MVVYYKNIKGKNYDGKIIRMAESLSKGRGDGRISLRDAKLILGSVKDSGKYSDIEKQTMKYIRDNFSFTPEADNWFRTEIRKWTAVKKSTQSAPRKPARKPVKKKVIAKTKKKAISPPARTFEEEYQREDTIVLQKAGMADAEGKEKGSKKKTVLIIVAAIVILAGLIIALFQCPEFKEWMRKQGWSGGAPKTEKADSKKEAIIPLKDTQKPVDAEKQQATVPQETGAEYYTVQVKDDLVSISEKVLKDYSKWKDLYEANKDIIKNPYIIYPGQKLKIPGNVPKK